MMNEPSRALPLHLSPSRTVVTSFNSRQNASTPPASNGNNSVDVAEAYFDDGEWVLFVNSSPSSIRCALSNGELQIYDPRGLHVTQTFRNFHGSGMITDLVGAPPQQNADHILVSSGTDGRVCVMDLRQPANQASAPSVVCSMPHSNEQALSVSLGYDGNLAAVGTNKSKIHFYDLRQAHQPVGSYVNSHTDDVTRVRFQHFPQHHVSSPTNTANSGLLLTGSEDGLACVFDTTQPSEEAALKSVMNAQTSLRQVGFFGPNLEGAFCMTGSETLSLWSWDSAQCLADYSDIRTTLGVDYLVNAYWDHSRNDLSLLSGSSNGEAVFSTLGITIATNGQRPPITTSHRLEGGHRGVVRDWCPVSASMLVTVGEDARICEWDMTAGPSQSVSIDKGVGQPANVAQTQHSSRKVSGGPTRRQKNKRSAAPY